MPLGIVLVGLLLILLAGGGRHLLGCAWHLFLGAVVFIVVAVIILAFLTRHVGYA
jgi:hypothetical protein